MNMNMIQPRRSTFYLLIFSALLILSACAGAREPSPSGSQSLRIVTTTTVIADVVRQIAGAEEEVLSILPPGADPHAYEATSADLRALSGADIVFINGLDLEESMRTVLLEADDRLLSLNDSLDKSILIHSELGDADDDHGRIDPHTWLDPEIVYLWTEIIEAELSRLRPQRAAEFSAGATAYRAELSRLSDELERRFASLPEERRTLVSEHDSLAYLARAFDLRMAGSVLPSVSTVAEPSAGHLAELHDLIRSQGVQAIFVEAPSNRAVVQELASDLGIPVVPLYIGGLSDGGGPAATYLQMMRYNADQIIQALTGGE